MKSISKKSITFSIILLFLGVSFSSGFYIDTETTQVNDCGCNEIDDKHIQFLEKQLNRLKVYSKLLLVLSRYYPELEKISKELINEISIVNNKVNSNFGYCLSLFFLMIIAGEFFIYLDIILSELQEDSTLYKILINLYFYFENKFSQIIDLGERYDCWWIYDGPPD